MTPRKFPVWPLTISLFVFFALTAALIARVPLGQSPDEAAHWQYVEHIAQIGNLPTFRGAAPPAPGYEFHQPPLYYLLCAPAWKIGGAGVQNYACRAVSLVCGLLTIALIWRAARLLFPDNWRVAGLAAGFSALFPLHQAVSAGSNNDSLAGLVSAALFYGMARPWIRGATKRDAWQIGLVAGCAILTKNTLLVVTATALISLFLAMRRPDSRVRPLTGMGIALGLMFLLGGPWLARNQVLYGDPLALRAFSAAANAIGPGFAEFSVVLDFFSYARALVWMIFLTAWGFFGGPNSAIAATEPLGLSQIPGPRVPQLYLAPLMLICLATPLLALLGLRRLTTNDSQFQESQIDDLANGAAAWRGAVKFWWVGMILIFLAWAQFAYAHFAGGQARYFHAALLPFCVLGAAGWSALWGEGRALVIASFLVAATLLLLTLLNVFGWKTLV